MNHLLYFFPDKHGVTPALLNEVGLSAVLEGMSPSMREVMGGPGGHTGVCAAFRRSDREELTVLFDAEAQHWEECSAGQFWIGYTLGQQPGPQDLARKVQIDGHEVELADGNRWRIPLVRQWNGQTNLPVRIKLAPDGQELQSVNPKYQPLYDRIVREWESIFNEGYQLTYGDMMQIAVMALGTNYHIGKWEASVLGLFDTQNLRAVFDALIDMAAWLEMIEAQKKTELVGDTSNA